MPDGTWFFLVLAVLALAPLVVLTDARWLRERAEQSVLRLTEAGWAPPPTLHETAIRQVIGEHRLSAICASVCSLVGLVGVVATGAHPSWWGWGWGLGVAAGAIGGKILAHLGAGRLGAGTQVVELRRRGAWGYLPTSDRTAAVLQVGVTVSCAAVLGLAALDPAPQPDLTPVLIMTGAVAWPLLPALTATAVARSSLAATSRDALRWQDAWRSVLIRDVARLLTCAPWFATGALLVAHDVWRLPDWWGAAILVAIGATLVSMALPLHGRPVLDPVPAHVQEA